MRKTSRRTEKGFALFGVEISKRSIALLGLSIVALVTFGACEALNNFEMGVACNSKAAPAISGCETPTRTPVRPATARP